MFPSKGFLYGTFVWARGRLTARNGGSRPGQYYKEVAQKSIGQETAIAVWEMILKVGPLPRVRLSLGLPCTMRVEFSAAFSQETLAFSCQASRKCCSYLQTHPYSGNLWVRMRSEVAWRRCLHTGSMDFMCATLREQMS